MYHIQIEKLKDGSKKKNLIGRKLKERLKAKQLVVFKELNQGERRNLDKDFNNSK